MSVGLFEALGSRPGGGPVLALAAAAAGALALFVAAAGEPGVGGALSAYTLCYVLLAGTLWGY